MTTGKANQQADASQDEHTVPRSYLAAWYDAAISSEKNPRVWSFRRDGSGSKSYSPSNLFKYADFYGRDLENWLQVLDDKFVKARRLTFEKHGELTPEREGPFLDFVAAMRLRTIKQHAHWNEQLRPIGVALTIAGMARPGGEVGGPSESRGLVDRVAAKPVPVTLPLGFDVERFVVGSHHRAILETDDGVGFITSDAPFVIADPRIVSSPLATMLGRPRGEFCFFMPMSPRQALLLNPWEVTGYVHASAEVVDEMNRLSRINAHEYFIVNTETKRPVWFEIDGAGDRLQSGREVTPNRGFHKGLERSWLKPRVR